MANRNRSNGRPSKKEQLGIQNVLKPFFQRGVSANATAKETKLNIKTVRNYFREWEKDLVEDTDFLERCKIEKERSVLSLDNEIISLDKLERELELLIKKFKKAGNYMLFEKFTKLIIKIKEQKWRLYSEKINLINTPTADTIVEIERHLGEDNGN